MCDFCQKDEQFARYISRNTEGRLVTGFMCGDCWWVKQTEFINNRPTVEIKWDVYSSR